MTLENIEKAMKIKKLIDNNKKATDEFLRSKRITIGSTILSITDTILIDNIVSAFQGIIERLNKELVNLGVEL